MKIKLLLSSIAIFAISASAANPNATIEQVKIYINPGHGTYTGNDRPMATGECISFNLPSTKDVDTMYEQLQSRPVIGLKGPPAYHPNFPVYSFFFSDPNGYTLEYQKPVD